MRITYDQLKTVLETTPKKHLKATLKYIFSFKENIDTFGYYFFPDACTSKSAKFHKEIHKLILNKEHVAIAAPRGHAKSTVVGLIDLSFIIVNKLKKYIVYMSQNHEKTIQFVEPISTTFKTNERIKFVYGDLSPKSLKDEITKKDRQDLIDIGGVRIQAVSFNRNIRGFKYINQRPDLIIGDDIDDDERVINPDLRARDRDKLMKQVLPSLSEGGQFKMIGTNLHFDCLLMNRIKHYNGRIYKACELNDDGSIDESTILWPEFWSVERLEKEKKNIGSVAFSSEYLNNPIENTASIIKRVWIKKCLDESLSYKEAKAIKYEEKKQGCDFAFGDRVINDRSAYICVGSNPGDKYTIFDITPFKGLSITDQFNRISKRHNVFELDETVMEENSIKSMTKELYKWNFDYYLIWTGASDTAAKLKPTAEFQDKRHTVSKKNMILRLSALFENGEFRIPYKTESDKRITDELIGELLTFALDNGKLVEIGVHADLPIALAMCMERMSNDDSGGEMVWI